MINTKLEKEKKIEFDTFSDLYLECVTACSLSEDEIDCMTECVAIFFKEEFNHD